MARPKQTGFWKAKRKAIRKEKATRMPMAKDWLTRWVRAKGSQSHHWKDCPDSSGRIADVNIQIQSSFIKITEKSALAKATIATGNRIAIRFEDIAIIIVAKDLVDLVRKQGRNKIRFRGHPFVGRN